MKDTHLAMFLARLSFLHISPIPGKWLIFWKKCSCIIWFIRDFRVDSRKLNKLKGAYVSSHVSDIMWLKHCYTVRFFTTPLWSKLLENYTMQQWLQQMFLCCASLRIALQEVQLISTFRNALQQLVTPLHSVSLLQQLSSQFLSHVLYKRMRELFIFSETVWVLGVFKMAAKKYWMLRKRIAQSNSTLRFWGNV